MELEFKHIAPYLPYDLKIKWTESKEIYGINFDSETDFTNNLYPLSTLLFSMTQGKELGWKPILRPLKDLSEIKGKGVSYTSYLWYEVITTDSENFNKDDFYDNCELGLIEHLPIIVYEQLLKWHFDIFNLIPKGIAVDINTLSVE